MRVVTIALAALLAAGTTVAHHGWSGYDASKPIKLTGTVQESEWANPHATIQLEVAGNNSGPAKVWTGTLAPLSRMSARGLKAESIKPGTMLTIEGLPSKSNQSEVKVERLIVNGKTFEIRR